MTNRKWFAWKPVYAGAAHDGSRKKGWVWLQYVEVIVAPRPGDDRAGPTGGLYRKMPLGKIDDFGLRQSPQLPERWLPPTLATDKPIYREPPRRGEADQFGGPRIIVDKRDRYYMPEGGD